MVDLVAFMVAGLLGNKERMAACINQLFRVKFLLEELVGPEKGQDVV